MSIAPVDPSKSPDNRMVMELGAVLPRTAQVRDGHLWVGGVDMVGLAQSQGTALYVMDEDHLRARMREYREAFSAAYPQSHVLYASKAFLNKEMARIANEEGMWLDVSGGGELACARSVGFPEQHVFVHGNNKTPQELREAMEAGVGRIVIDSRIELHRVSQIAGELGITQKVLMRVTPGVEAATHAYIQTGAADSKFGFTMSDDFAFRCVADVLAEPNVELTGLHCHIGSQIFDIASFGESVGIMVSLLSRIKQHYGVELGDLDMGGGLGIAYTVDEEPPSVAEYARFLAETLRAQCEAHDFALPHLYVEPGRSIVANAGVTLYTVGIVKTLPGIRKYVSVDGGISDNIRNALYDASYEAVLANKADEPRSLLATIAGKHCESGDVVVRDVSLQPVVVGDVVCVFATGAYCYTMSSTYNGQPRPAVVFVKDGIARITTRRETYEDLYSRDI